ncbi:MAG: acyl carrier protein [Clostridia bacterium]|nr:acyl carrier protein [Clostridia bacterium]
MAVFEFLRKAVHELVGVPEEEIRPESTKEELKLDSFDVEELVIDVEKEYDIYLTDTDFDTLGELARLVMAA